METETRSGSPWLWIKILKFDLVTGHRLAVSVEYDKARRRRPLVYAADEDLPPFAFPLTGCHLCRLSPDSSIGRVITRPIGAIGAIGGADSIQTSPLHVAAVGISHSVRIVTRPEPVPERVRLQQLRGAAAAAIGAGEDDCAAGCGGHDVGESVALAGRGARRRKEVTDRAAASRYAAAEGEGEEMVMVGGRLPH